MPNPGRGKETLSARVDAFVTGERAKHASRNGTGGNMMYRLYGMGAAMLFVLGVGGYSAMNRVSNYTPATASVFLIDRNCDIIETTKTRQRHADKFARLHRRLQVDRSVGRRQGQARQDHFGQGRGQGQLHRAAGRQLARTSELKFTSRDDEFYALKAGDEIRGPGQQRRPDKIIKA